MKKELFVFVSIVLMASGMMAQGNNIPSSNPAYASPENYKTAKTCAYSNGNHDYYFCFVENKVGMIDDKKRVIIPIEYDEVLRFSQRSDQYLLRKGEDWGLVDEKGIFLVPPVVSSIKRLDSQYIEVTEHDGSINKVLFEGGWANDMKILRAYLAQKYEYGKYFIPRIDSTANVVFVDEYWTSGEFNDGMMPVWDKASKKLGFLNTKGEWAIPYSIKMDSKPFMDSEIPFFSAGYLVLCQMTEPYSYDYVYRIYDKSGTLLWTMNRRYRQGNTSYIRRLSHYVDGGFALEHIESNNVSVFKYVSPTGKELFPSVYAGKSFRYNASNVEPKDYVRPMRNGMVAYPDFSKYRDTRWGFFDKNGTVIVKAIYSKAHDFHEGLAAVQMADTEENPGKWGFIDTTGKLVIPAIFSKEPIDFSEGLAIVQKTNGNYVYINTKGEVVSPEFAQALPFVKGAAFVKSYVGNGETEQFAVDHVFNTVSHYLEDDMFAYFTIKQVMEAASHPERAWSGIFYDAINERTMYTSWGEQFTIYDKEDHKINITDGIVCITERGNPDNKAYCDFTGKTLFFLWRNEF